MEANATGIVGVVDTKVVGFEGALDLRRTLRPLTFPWGRFAVDGWWRAMRTPEGPATLHLTRDERGIHARSWGPGSGWALGRVEQVAGLHDDPTGFTTDHPLIRGLARRHLGVRFGRTGLVFEALVYAVVGQKVTGKEAKAGLRGLMERFSEPAPGPTPGLRLPPDSRSMADAPYHAYHDLGIEKRRADVLGRLASDAERIDRLAGLEPEAARAHLQRYPGVGQWTSAEVTAISHGDADAVSVGDFHLKHLVSWNLAGEPRGSDEAMLALLEPFRPHRGRVIRWLEIEGDYPRYGPRKPVRSFATY